MPVNPDETNPVSRRVFVSMPADGRLSYEQNELKWGIVKRISTLGYIPEIFHPPSAKIDINRLTSHTGWSPKELQRVLLRCSGTVIIGLTRWLAHSPVDGPDEKKLATEYTQYEAGVAYALQLPTLYLAEKDLSRHGAFDRSAAQFITEIPDHADASWLNSQAFNQPFNAWVKTLKDRYDIFLAYSTVNELKAGTVRDFLEINGVKVMDWQKHFTAGDSIMHQIATASSKCASGIFMFTDDDIIEGSSFKAAPRDNVVFEAGYFASVKGDDRILIIKESSAKMPADLGGKIYVPMENGELSQSSKLRILTFLREQV